MILLVCRCGLSIDAHCTNQPNKSRLALYKPLIRKYSCLKQLYICNKTIRFINCTVTNLNVNVRTWKLSHFATFYVYGRLILM